MSMGNAEVCRRQGWGPGTIVQVSDEMGAARFRITTIGESVVLGKQVSSMEFGFGWTRHEGSREQVIGVRLEGALAVSSVMGGNKP